jgi:hypothetical protein
MNHNKACHIRFNTAANKLEQLPYSIFKASTLSKLIFPLNIVTRYDRDNFFHSYETVQEWKDLSFSSTFKEDYECLYFDFLQYNLNHSYLDSSINDEIPLIHFLYFHSSIPKEVGFAQEVCIPHARYVNSAYYFNTLLENENIKVTFNLLLELLYEQVALTNSFYIETSVVNFSLFPPENITYLKAASDFAYYEQIREENIELESGDTVASFIVGVNYFSKELWNKLCWFSGNRTFVV